jgi:phage host-nuclease inhibitor protein Gam
MGIFERLDEQLMEPNEPFDKEAWEIRDMDAAAWASRKARAASDAIADVDAWEQREIERIKDVADHERTRMQNDLDFFTNHLGAYLGKLVNEGRKTKSLDLPGGRVALRNQQPKVDIVDDAAIDWALRENLPQVTRTKVVLDRRGFRDQVELVEGGAVVFRATGEVLDFARWTEAEQKVYFTTEVE